MDDKFNTNPMMRASLTKESIRVPSRDKNTNPPDVRKKAYTSGQNFFKEGVKDPMSESTSVLDDLMLNALNIAIDETGFVATTKADILQLQEEINRMDLDGKLRNTNPSDLLKKNHIYAMVKFLQRYANINVKKQIDQKLLHASTFDPNDLVKFMGLKSEGEALRKLFKIIGILDIMLTKLTEYNVISYMKYEQIFEALRRQFNGPNLTKNTTMDAGIVISRFQVILANLEREYELFSYIGKLMQAKGSDIKSEVSTDNKVMSVTTIDELYERLRSGEHFGFQGEVAVGLINMIEAQYKKKEPEPVKKDTNGITDAQKKEVMELQKKIQKLESQLNEKNTIIQQVQKEAADQEEFFRKKEQELIGRIQNLEQLAKKNEKRSDTTFQTDTREQELTNQLVKLEKTVKDLKEELSNSKERENKLEQEISRLRSKPTANPTPAPTGNEYYLSMIQQLEENYNDKGARLAEENLKLSSENVTLYAKVDHLEVEKQELNKKIKDLQRQEMLDKKGKDDQSYEAALKEQFNSMKQTFEEKIKQLNDEVLTIKKDKGREILELKNNLSREKENRELLLRKLQIYSKT